MSCGEGGCGCSNTPAVNDAVENFCEAARHGHLPYITRALNADTLLVTGINKDGWTALHLAAHHGHAEIVELLIERGASLHTRSTSSIAPGNTPLHAAVAGDQAETVGILLERGAAVNSRQEKSGFTPLHVAAFAASEAVVLKLLDYDADKSMLSVEGQTAQDMALAKGKSALAELLTPPAVVDTVVPPDWEGKGLISAT